MCTALAVDDCDSNMTYRPTPADAGLPLSDAAARDAGRDEASLELGFDPPAGTYEALPSVSLHARDESQLYYSLDGSAPDSSSTPYTTAIVLEATTLLRVAEYRDGELVQRRSASYIAVAPQLVAASSNLPLLVVHMLSGPEPAVSSTVLVPAVAQLHEHGTQNDGRVTLVGSARLDARVGIKVHGRSSRKQPKHSFKLEFRAQDDSDDEQAQLLDLPPQSDWVLDAPYTLDRALIRDPLFYQLSRNLGRYAPRTRFVELYLAQSGKPLDADSYRGVFILTESVKRDHNRVDIRKLSAEMTSPSELGGGYIVAIDAPAADDLTLPVLGIPTPVLVHYPKPDRINDAQRDYLANYLNSTARALQAADHIDPQSLRAANDLLDVDSFIDHHILNLFAKNPDGLRLSTFMYKDRNGKLNAGPVWDCDRCMGSYDGRDADPESWLPTLSGMDLFDFGWWSYLFADPEFEARYWARFAELLDEQHGALRTAAVLSLVEQLASELDEVAARNAQRYPEAAPVDNVYQHEVDVLSSWLARRIAWARANLGQRP